MAKSTIDEIKESTTLSDTDKIDQLYNKIKQLVSYLTNMHNSVANEAEVLDALMDANGNNSEEHHAKTMVYYGRKLANRELFLGVNSSDAVFGPPLNVSPFTGLDTIIPEFDYGRVTLEWNCMYYKDGSTKKSMSSVYKNNDPTDVPATETLQQKHTLGAKVVMPTIKNMDTDGTGAGTNSYKLKSGYIINGWVIDPTTPQYLYDDTGNDYLYKTVSGSKVKVPAQRVFAFGSNSYRMPYNTGLAPLTPPNSTVKFILDIVPIWFEIEFVIRHGTAGDAAPCKVPIKTRLGNTITLPATTLITMDAGYKIDTSVSVYGEWTTVDPNNPGVPQPDPDGDPIPDKDFTAGTDQVVGTDLDAGIRKLYLKITTA